MSIASEITRLQTAKAGLKTAIEAKGVTVPASTTLDGYPELVSAIPSGTASGDYREATKYTTKYELNLSGDQMLPERVSLSFAKGGSSTFKITGNWLDRGIRYLDIYDFQSNMSIDNLIVQCYNMDTITFVGDYDIVIKSMNVAFQYSNVKHIIGTLDVSSCASAWALNAYVGTDLYDITFKESTIKYNISFGACSHLNDASLISIANGLNETVTGQSLTLHATPKARCATLMGVNNSGTFEESSSGTLSLSDFITTIKGWTLS